MIGAYMARHALVPDLVLVSAAAAHAGDLGAPGDGAGRAPPPVRYEDRLYNAGTERSSPW